MRTGLKNTSIVLLSALAISTAIAFIALYYAPGLLVYADRPVKSDVIVLFKGKGSDREKEALLLLGEGYSPYLIIPAQQFPQYFINRGRNKRNSIFPPYYEQTHLEVLIAERLMKEKGFKSAIFVSSPYHMRRIRLMTEKIFGKELSNIVFVPTRFEASRPSLVRRTLSNCSNAVSEYAKILWFLMYSPFAPS